VKSLQRPRLTTAKVLIAATEATVVDMETAAMAVTVAPTAAAAMEATVVPTATAAMEVTVVVAVIAAMADDARSEEATNADALLPTDHATAATLATTIAVAV